MERLNIMLVAEAIRDVEAAQYRFLSILQSIGQHFRHNDIYPYLSDLIDFRSAAKELLSAAAALQSLFPKNLVGIDLERMQALYEALAPDSDTISQAKELLQWVLPRVEAQLEEGKTIFDFVDERMDLHPVGIIPQYILEGYIFIPDPINNSMHICRYEMTHIFSAGEKYRTLRTSEIECLPLDTIQKDERAIKLELIERFRELPNPACYSFAVDVEFPFESTIFPIAKRKLMRYLSAA